MASRSEAPQTLTLLAGLQRLGDGARAWRPEGTQDWLLTATLGGRGCVRAADRWHALQRGHLMLIAPRTAQAYGHDEHAAPWHNIWIHFRPRAQWLPWLRWPALAKGVMLLPVGDGFERFETELQQLVEVAGKPQRLAAEAAMNHLERVLIWADALNPEQQTAARDARIHKALELIADQLAEPLSVEAIAQAVGLSRARFSTLFAHQVGRSPQVYIESLRLARAAQLLRSSSWQVGQIAQAVGFADPLYFSTRFRRQFGMTPTDYRGRASTSAP